jgi:hypothetical protein
MAAGQGQPVSLKPSDAVTGGGLYDDLDVEIKQCRFKLWDYQGAIAKSILGLGVTFVIDDASQGGEFEQIYSAGDTKHFVPSDDGREAVRVGSQEGLSESSNAILFLRSLVNSGFPENQIGSDVSVFEGTRCHVNRQPQPKRAGLKVGDDEKKKDVLIVTKIHSLPGEKAKGKKLTGKVAKVAEQVAAGAGTGVDANGAVHDKAVETMLAILASKGGTIKKGQIAQAAFQQLAKDPLRNQVTALIFKDEFLSEAGQPWTFSGQEVSLDS